MRNKIKNYQEVIIILSSHSLILSEQSDQSDWSDSSDKSYFNNSQAITHSSALPQNKPFILPTLHPHNSPTHQHKKEPRLLT
ncbi:hypothetical protein [Prevotella sp.]|uniref:hypothetical protein n=1 Tax=Prevotella sp. TaxID=59823 RepID=UPI002F921DF3